MKNRLRLSVQNLRNRIAQMGMKKGELAHEIGITPETLSRWLAGKVEYIDEGMLIRLSEQLKCSLAELSPEIAVTRREALPLKPIQKIPGDELLRMGLYRGDWKSLLALIEHDHTHQAIEDADITLALAKVFQNTYDLSVPETQVDTQSKEIVLKNYEKFDILARACLAQGIMQLLSNNTKSAVYNFKRTVVQSQTEWVLALASLLAGFAESIYSKNSQYWLNLASGLQHFEKSTDDFTAWISANTHLMITKSCISYGKPESMFHLERAKTIFQNLGIKHGYVRCASYDLLCLAAQKKLTEFATKQEEVMSIMQKLPRLYKYESLMICSYAFSLLDNTELALQYLGIADELSVHNPALTLLTKKRMLELLPGNKSLSDEITRLEKDIEEEPQTQKWWIA